MKKTIVGSLKGLAGRLSIGAFSGVFIARMVDSRGIWEALWLGVLLAFFFFIVHIMVYGHESN